MRRAIPAIVLCVALVADAHEGHTDRAPWDACAASALGATCQWETAQHALHQGTCREIGGALMCVRNKPVVHGADPDGPGRTAWAGVGGVGLATLGAGMWLRQRSGARR